MSRLQSWVRLAGTVLVGDRVEVGVGSVGAGVAVKAGLGVALGMGVPVLWAALAEAHPLKRMVVKTNHIIFFIMADSGTKSVWRLYIGIRETLSPH